MGFENDQLVYDYLSRVGDLAQQRELPESDRMRLVSTLRSEIDDRRRSTDSDDDETTETVRGILGALGTPDEVVAKAAVPAPRQPDWWSTEGEDVLGFQGVIERPDLFYKPEPEPEEEDPESEEREGPPERRSAWTRAKAVLRRRKPEEPEDEAHEDHEDQDEQEEYEEPSARARSSRLPRFSNPFVLLAALLLLGGAVYGSLIALAAGWILAYASRRLNPGEIKTAVLVLPGLAATAGIAWIWGRVAGRWGEPIEAGGPAMSAAIGETWPWVLRGAATASALFLVWRSRRR
ncbi:hypothetical protein AB0G79_03830 [Streptomyces sp. NPDC020807]|uniref:hypothetical protein n=1 Tax=Streptomyces sp. NPDC020807 TaxID=3155119 RepID=UPI0033ED4014